MLTVSSSDTPPVPPHRLEDERYRRFGEELDAVKERAFKRVGAEDVRYVRRLNRFSLAMEVIGRFLIHVSFEPIAFAVGVFALWIHKQLQATEIGHSALHGAYDRLPGAEAFASKKFRWDTPIDEESWRHAHNVRHHGNTNVLGRDPDVHFGPVRLTEHAAWTPRHRWQLPFALGVLFPFFGLVINLHVTGLSDAYTADGRPFDILPDSSKASIRAAWKKALRKYAPYYLYNFVLFPVLAGPFFWKVLLGNAMAEMMRDVYSAATIFCGHIGDAVHSYPAGARAHGRGHWYAMQVQSTNNFDVSRPISVLCGGLDLQIEHHLFPTLPPPRLREIAPEVRAICERHGVEYRMDTWGRTLLGALEHIGHLARSGGLRAVVREMA
ncbi:MAG: fatty acid desaturase family protein [Polyangiaceae bacterium]|jgi:NADPH-dependent stearoyl-CoA 9-desaturase